MSKIWYQQPAQSWDKALPLGNGRIGAMIFGGISNERIALNEDSVWSGGPRNRVNPDAYSNLPRIRELIFAGKIPEAEELACCALSGTPNGQRMYQTLGDLSIAFSHESAVRQESYVRELSLDEAEAHVRYATDGAQYERRAYISAPDDVLVLTFRAEGSELLNFRCHLTRERIANATYAQGGHTIAMAGATENDGIRYVCMARAVSDGQVCTTGDFLLVSGAREATVYLTAATSFRVQAPEEFCSDVLERAAQKGEAAIRADHIAEHSAYFSRVTLNLGDGAYDALPTDIRLRHHADDPSLAALYFDYGRYLLIACSRPGTLPATLQGIWNDRLFPPWDSKYTININTEMNYWPAESCALPEMHMPLFELLWPMLKNGQDVARRMYGCRGFTAHHNTDVWADCAPQDQYIPATYWPMGAAWLCLHIRTHYAYTQDEAFLREYFELVEQAALFFVDYLIENADGYAVTCPSVSPENTYILPDGTRGRLCYAATMDNQILHALFSDYLWACGVLGIKGAYAAEVRGLLDKLPPPAIGQHGQLMEWIDDYAEEEPGHRHISHLFGLYPGDQFTTQTPELLEACRATLTRRLMHGGGHTGWSRAWIIGLWARLCDGEKAEENVRALLSGSTFENMMDTHPYGQGGVFQIDGNLGATAAIAEMLVCSRDDRLILLPALPKAWASGSIRGLRARGGICVDLSWKDGMLERCSLTANKPIHLIVEYAGQAKECDIPCVIEG